MLGAPNYACQQRKKKGTTNEHAEEEERIKRKKKKRRRKESAEEENFFLKKINYILFLNEGYLWVLSLIAVCINNIAGCTYKNPNFFFFLWLVYLSFQSFPICREHQQMIQAQYELTYFCRLRVFFSFNIYSGLKKKDKQLTE